LKNQETVLLIAIQQALAATRRCIVWRNSVGFAKYGAAYVPYGLCVGAADLIGLTVPGGRFLAIEVKTPVGRTKPEQLAFAQAVTRAGGFHAFVRSVPEAIAAIDSASAPVTT
jgi:hypothetical protein